MTNLADWQGEVGCNWAAEWRRTDTSFSELTPHLLAAIAKERGTRIVDIGCGAGELSIAVAAARPGANVIGVDISPDLVAAASMRAGIVPKLSFILADASVWSNPDDAPDLYVSRHGVMFFPDPPAAFRHLAEAAAPRARMVFSCFRKAVDNGWATAISNLLPKAQIAAADRYAPGPFAFAEPDHVRDCLQGWRDIAFSPIDFTYVAGDGPDAVAEAMALFHRIGPSAFAFRTLRENERDIFENRLLEIVEAHHDGTRVAFPAAAWLVSATSDHTHG